MRYVANPVVVDAFKITHVGPLADQGGDFRVLTLEGGRLVQADKEMMSRMTPQVGDYWVIQSDGYIYLNPKDVFERKYSPEKLFNFPNKAQAAKDFTPGEGKIGPDGKYSGDPQGAEILANVQKIRRD